MISPKENYCKKASKYFEIHLKTCKLVTKKLYLKQIFGFCWARFFIGPKFRGDTAAEIVLISIDKFFAVP